MGFRGKLRLFHVTPNCCLNDINDKNTNQLSYLSNSYIIFEKVLRIKNAMNSLSAVLEILIIAYTINRIRQFKSRLISLSYIFLTSHHAFLDINCKEVPKVPKVVLDAINFINVRYVLFRTLKPNPTAIFYWL